MGRLVAIAALLAGCYSARAFPGAPCTSEGACPSGLACVANLCELPNGDSIDASSITGGDGATNSFDAPDAEGPAGPNGWHAATHVPGVNTSSTETDPCFTDDDLTIVFASDRAGGTGGIDLYIATRGATTDAFTVRELSELDSTATDQSPEISSDGTAIFFSSTRNGNNAQIFTATRGSTAEPFGAPTEVAAMSKNPDNLVNATSIGVGSTTIAIVVFSQNGTNEPDGYAYLNSAWVDQENLDGANGGTMLPTDFTDPSLTPDASTIYYAGGSPAQIFMVTYDETSDTFSAPVNISELNLGTRDAAPEISAGGTHIAFERDGDLFEATK